MIRTLLLAAARVVSHQTRPAAKPTPPHWSNFGRPRGLFGSVFHDWLFAIDQKRGDPLAIKLRETVVVDLGNQLGFGSLDFRNPKALDTVLTLHNAMRAAFEAGLTMSGDLLGSVFTDWLFRIDQGMGDALADRWQETVVVDLGRELGYGSLFGRTAVAHLGAVGCALLGDADRDFAVARLGELDFGSVVLRDQKARDTLIKISKAMRAAFAAGFTMGRTPADIH